MSEALTIPLIDIEVVEFVQPERQFSVVSVPPSAAVPELTLRQYEELDLGSRGDTIAEMAAARYHFSRSIKAHRTELCKKLAARNFVHAVRRGYERELFTTQLDGHEVMLEELTPIQMKELELASLGYSVSRAMALRHRSRSTIRTERSEVLRRFNATRMAHAVRIAIETGILSIDQHSAVSNTAEMPEMAVTTEVAL